VNELFRFVLIRPANLPETDDVKPLDGSFLEEDDPPLVRRRKAAEFVRSGGLLTSLDRLFLRPTATAVAAALSNGAQPAETILELIEETSGMSPDQVISNPRFAEDERALADSLVAIKLLSSSRGADAPGLTSLARAYDAIRLAIEGLDPVKLRTLAVAAANVSPPSAGTSGMGPPTGVQPHPGGQPPRVRSPIDRSRLESQLATIDKGIAELSSLPPASFHIEPAPPLPRPDRPAAGPGVVERPSALPAAPESKRAWALASGAVHALPADVRETLKTAGLDPATDTLPTLLTRLFLLKSELRSQLVVTSTSVADGRRVYPVGNQVTPISADDYVGSPAASLPTTVGEIRPVGVGDLMMVKQHVLRYEGGDLAHVENVLKSEKTTRETRRLERTETTIVQETEVTREEQRDTQTTDRFSLKRETTNTLREDAQLKAGLSVDSKYGPTTEVKANAEGATSVSSETSIRQATEFSKDVVDRTVSKVVERVLERRSVTMISEFEEKYSHGFDNTTGDGHISGMYQWIDKVLQAQVYRYGVRLLFDVTVPEPSTDFILAQTNAQRPGGEIVEPTPFLLLPEQLLENNYTFWAKKYDVVGLEPPPPPVKTIPVVFDAALTQDPHETTKSQTVAIDDGYQAVYASFTKDAVVYPGAHWRVMVGASFFDGMTAVAYTNMAHEVGSVGVAYDAYQIELLAASVQIFCTRTDRAFAAWQLKTHGAIVQGFLVKQEAYRQAVAQARAEVGAQVSGRNPAFNQRVVATELRKQCLTLLTAQQFDAFGALELSAEGHAQPNLSAVSVQMPYVRFFEHAFEWERIVYFFHPYFWGWKPGWRNRMLIDDTDPAFADFLRAGAGRVVFPVRPGFESAIIHYLETGEIWNGGPPPDVTSPLYVPIIKEIQEATGAPGNEEPVGEPWQVHLPTTLVRLRPNDDLPEWHKVGENWEPTN
jgi:hypothetical protein